ncbi:MAG: phosphate ABC transporter substrate-binding protein [Phycisphaerales bacterium]
MNRSFQRWPRLRRAIHVVTVPAIHPVTLLRLVAIGFFVLYVLVMLTACGTRGEQLTVTGASTLAPILDRAGDDLKREHPELSVSVRLGGSTKGISDTLEGINDLGAVARDLTADEAAHLRQFTVAHDGVAIVVHASNPLSGLTTEQLRRIYLGEIGSWKELGVEPGAAARDRRIIAVSKAEGHATLEVFLAHTGIARAALRPSVIAGNNAVVLATVSESPDAIGYVSLGESQQALASGLPIRLVPLDGKTPSVASVADGSWPMIRPLLFVSRDEPAGWAKVLLDYFESERGRETIRACGFVPVD